MVVSSSCSFLRLCTDWVCSSALTGTGRFPLFCFSLPISFFLLVSGWSCVLVAEFWCFDALDEALQLHEPELNAEEQDVR